MKIRGLNFPILLIFSLLIFLSIGTASAANYTVNPGTSIQSVINNAANNDIITVNDNNGVAYVYTENLVINKKLQIKAKANSSVTIKASDVSKPVITINPLGNSTVIQGFIIRSATGSSGVLLNGSSKCNIKNNTIAGNYHGILNYNSRNSTIDGNKFSDNTYSGITFEYSDYNSVLNNNVINNVRGMRFGGSDYNTIKNNTITGSEAYGIGVESSANNLFQNNSATNNHDGIYVGIVGSFTGTTQYNTIKNNILTNNTESAIYLGVSQNSIIQNNSATNNQYGIYLHDSHNNDIFENYLFNNSYSGFLFGSSNNNHIYNNTASENFRGMRLGSCNYNTIENNSFTNSESYGIGFENSTYNLILNNNLINNYYGMYLGISSNCSNNSLQKNTITSNQYGVYLLNSSSYLNFNRIVGNAVHGLYNEGNVTVDALNNWWGSNNPIVSSNNGSDICINNGTVNNDLWLVLTINTSIGHVISNSSREVTIDLTRNNQGDDTSLEGLLPDGMPIYLNTTSGTINSTVFTKNGKSLAIFNYTPLSNFASISAVLDNQTTTKTIFGIYNNRTNEIFNTIQNAIDDLDTINGDTILIGGGIYSENIILNKNLTISSTADDISTINTLNSSCPIITINFEGSGSTIQNLILNGTNGSSGIYLNLANNCSILNNQLLNNQDGIFIFNGSENLVYQNNASSSVWNGINLEFANNNKIYVNDLTNNWNGIDLKNSSFNDIACNYVTVNRYGINLENNCHNNLIYGNNAINNTIAGISTSNNSTTNSIIYNYLSLNQYGMYISQGANDTIVSNIANNNSMSGINIYNNSNGNVVQSNSLFNNQIGLNVNTAYGNFNFNRIFNNSAYGAAINVVGSLNLSSNWWGKNSPNVSINSPSDIRISNGTVNYNSWFTVDIGFTSNQIINASNYVKTYIETNHQLPNYVNVSGIQVNMPQFLKLSTQTLIDVYNGINNTYVLRNLGSIPNHMENITKAELVDSEYLSIARNIVYSMDCNGTAPNNISNTSLGSTISFESLVYIYSNILGSYGNNNQTLPDSISVTPWIAISNPNKAYNFRTQEVFDTIQAAIDDGDTIANDTIFLWKGIYLENVIINKTITIESIDGNVTVSALNSTLPVFTINTLGNGSIIQNIFINGSLSSIGVYIENSFNNTILNNVITSNGNGIYLYNSTDNEISSNLISNNTLNGVFVYLGENNTFSGNNLTYNGNGIILNNTLNNTICINLISKNVFDGINIVNSSADVSFNVISQNGRYGLYNQGNSTVDALNNWWGYNPPVTGPTDIYNSGGLLNCDKWIVMNVNSTCDRSNRTGACYNYVITADLTHNNQGNDTSGDGNIPDGIPVNFVTDVGTVVSTGYTRNGKAVNNLNSSTPGLANVSVTLDNQMNNITVNVTSINVLGIYNNRTHEGFTTIQGAINDNDTLNGDIITLSDGTYAENVVVNKTVIIRPVDGSLVTFVGSDSSLAVFNITSSGSGSIITGLTIIGSEDSYGVFLNDTINCNITGNIITGNDIGIYLHLSNNNTIEGNSLIDNYYGMGLCNSTNNNISGNYLTGNYYGVYLEVSNFNLVIGNNATDNWDAIQLVNSTSNSILNNTIKGNWIGSYLYLSNNTLISGNIFVDNGAGICYHDSNNTSISGNNFTENWIIDASEIDSSNMVVASTIYTCGPAALATVMMHMGLNATEADLANWAGTDETGTSMWGLVQAANKTGLTAYGLILSIDQLKTDYIVVLSIDDNKHYAIIRNITDTTVYLIDPNLGNIEMNLTEFTNAYTGYVLVINNITEINGTLLNETQMKDIKGLKWVKKVKKQWINGYYYYTTEKRKGIWSYTIKFLWWKKTVSYTYTYYVKVRHWQRGYYRYKSYWIYVADNIKPLKLPTLPKIKLPNPYNIYKFYKDYYFGRSPGYWEDRIKNANYSAMYSAKYFGFHPSKDPNNYTNLGQLYMNFTANQIIDYNMKNRYSQPPMFK